MIKLEPVESAELAELKTEIDQREATLRQSPMG